MIYSTDVSIYDYMSLEELYEVLDATENVQWAVIEAIQKKIDEMSKLMN